MNCQSVPHCPPATVDWLLLIYLWTVAYWRPTEFSCSCLLVWMCDYNILCRIAFLYTWILFYFLSAVQYFDTMNENGCFSWALCKGEDNIPCAFEQERCCNVLNVGKSHKPNSSFDIHDFIHALHLYSHISVGQLCCSITDWQFRCNVNILLPTSKR